MTAKHRDFISDMVVQKKNILVAGSTNSGKTTLVNGVIDEISKKTSSDRIIVLEDTNEIICNSKNTLTMETSDERSMTQLVRDSLRHRPDRIIVGELRGSEALDLIDAWNTGHPGGLTTLHANNARSALKRLEQLIVRNNIPPQREEIAEVVNVVMFIKRDLSHPARRRVSEVIQVNGYDGDYVIEQV
jgi:type IV secretion system protein VirB11